MEKMKLDNKEKEERLQDMRAELELRVKVRTAELSSLNEVLRKEITERQKMSQQLIGVNSFLNNVFVCIQDGISVSDTKMNIIRVNPTMEKWYPYSLPLVGKKCYEAYHQRNKPCDVCPVKITLETQKPAHIVSPLEDKAKNVIGYFDLFSFPLFDEVTKELIGAIEYVRNITAQKKAENALCQSEEKFRLIAEFTYNWIYLVDSHRNMVYVSPSCKRITGYNQDDFMNDPELIMKIVHKDDIGLLLKQIKKVCDNSEKLESEFRILDKNNQVRWIHHTCVPVFDKDGRLIGRRASNRDITKDKDNENELKIYRENLEVLVKERTESLEEEIRIRKSAEENANSLNKRIEFILGATKTGLDIIDKDYNIQYVNPEWASYYGDWKGKKCFDYLKNRKSPCPECLLEEAFKAKKAVVSEEIMPKENNRPNQVTTIPFQDKDGKWLFARVHVDISEKKKIDKELELYRNDLECLVEERTQDLLQETARYKKSESEKILLNRELIKTNEKLKSVSLIDAHTGLYNYRYLQSAIESEFHQARRYAQSLALIMLDVDYFKSINDVYGVAFGDSVLKQLARQLKQMVRRYDVLIRYSGEEFIIISPRLNRNTAFNMAQRLLDSLNLVNFGNKKHSVKLKLSFSVAAFPDDKVTSGADLVNLVNKILIKTKEGGGNRAYSSLDLNHPLKKGMDKISKVMGIKILKNTINKLNRQTKQGLTEFIFAFAKTLEVKDHYSGEHVENTVHFATEIARKLDLPKDEIELIKQAAMLHDLGKIGISENILLKKGKLTKREFVEIRKHPQIGADIIRPIQSLHALIPFIFYHHERWDGKGYPSGIKGEDIPLGARIIAIADVYQALTSDRPYHKAFTKEVAIDMIKKSSGTQFDPLIVDTFLKVISREKKPRKPV